MMKRSLKLSFLLAFLSSFAWGDQNSTLIDKVIPSDAINAGHFGAAVSAMGELLGRSGAQCRFRLLSLSERTQRKHDQNHQTYGTRRRFEYPVRLFRFHGRRNPGGGGEMVRSKRIVQFGSRLSLPNRTKRFGTFLQKLVPSDANNSDNFGYSISVSDHLVAVGSPYHDQGGTVNAGSAYLYRVEPNGTVTYLSKVTASDANASDKFGSSLSLSGHLLAVGAYDDDHAGGVDAGSAYLFQLEQNGSATEVGKVTASDANASDKFGSSLSLSGNLIAVGAEMHDPNGLNSAGSRLSFPIGAEWIDFLSRQGQGWACRS